MLGSVKKLKFLELTLLAFITSCSAQPPTPPLKRSTSDLKEKPVRGDASDGTQDGSEEGSTPSDNEMTADVQAPSIPDDAKIEAPVPEVNSKEPAKPDPKVEPKPEDILTDPGTAGNGDFEVGPNYIDAPETQERSGVPKGQLKEFKMDSKDSKIFRGQDAYLKEKGDFSRQGWIYIPAGYQAGTELPFMLVGDGGWESHKALMPRILDNLIASKKVPPMALVFINPGPLGGGDGPGSQRSFEYDSVTPTFGDWVETEVLPKVSAEFNVKFTANPEGRGTMGGSSSGAMAFTMAWFKPDKYRRVLTYSGTFVNRIQTPDHPLGAWEYHSKLIPKSEKKPLRVFIHVSDKDLNFGPDNNWEAANRAMAKVFKEKSYQYRFVYSKNSGHIDGKVYRQTLPETLIWLWRGYPIPK